MMEENSRKVTYWHEIMFMSRNCSCDQRQGQVIIYGPILPSPLNQ